MNSGISQQLSVSYRTVIDESHPPHYFTFIDKKDCRLSFPVRGHGEAMAGQKGRDFELKYRLTGDTIVFFTANRDTSDIVLKRFINSRFITKPGNTLYDLVSGYTYVNKKAIDDKHTIYVIDGEIFKQKVSKTDGYGLIVKGYKTNRPLKRKIKAINADRYTVNILKGKPAYDKYGLPGMNGVIEMEQKK